MAANKAPQAIRAAKQALRKKVRTKLRALDEVTVREECMSEIIAAGYAKAENVTEQQKQ